jgi:hypothetical protein
MPLPLVSAIARAWPAAQEVCAPLKLTQSKAIKWTECLPAFIQYSI